LEQLWNNRDESSDIKELLAHKTTEMIVQTEHEKNSRFFSVLNDRCECVVQSEKCTNDILTKYDR